MPFPRLLSRSPARPAVLARRLAALALLAAGAGLAHADILIGHTLAWATAFKVPFEQDNLKAYAGRTLSRPALARASAREAGGATPAS